MRSQKGIPMKSQRKVGLFTTLGLVLFIGMVLSACSTPVEIRDSEWYGSRGFLGADAFHTLTTDSQELSYPEWLAKWNDLDHPIVCTSSDTFADWKNVIEKLCSAKGRCKYMTPEQKAALVRFFKIAAGVELRLR